MVVSLKTFNLKTGPYCDVINITNQVQKAVRDSNINDGLVNVHVAGSTAAISTTEYEPGLVKKDIENLLEKLIPYDNNYAHHNTWGDHNGAGHLRSTMLKTSQTFPIHNKNIILGTWQQIILLELDEKSRQREIYCTIIGE
ncbi:MAG: YjbQ family protein [Candidatus Lokiarchaeota archaeon]|nr:YjbQ family protein [Candidatus Lokiarchaeota archaeon]